MLATLILILVLSIGILIGAGLGIMSDVFDEDTVPDLDPEYDAACAWRNINLAIGNPDHYEANDDIADLRRAGWHVEKSGNERAGFVYLKFISPGHKE